MIKAKASLEEVTEYVRRNIILPNFENVEEFEILSTIRYDPGLTHVFPQSSHTNVDIRFDFLQKDNNDLVLGSISGNKLFNDNLSIDNETRGHDFMVDLLQLLEMPPALHAADAGMVTGTEKDMKLTFKERFFLLREHQQRLNLTMSYFEWDFEIPMSLLLDKLIEALPVPCSDDGNITLEQRMALLLDLNQSFKMRVLISKNGNMRIEAHPLPFPMLSSNDTQKYFINTLLSGFLHYDDAWDVYLDTQPIVISPFTTFKTTKRQHYTNARERMNTMSELYDRADKKREILVYNDAFQLMEGTITNVAVKKYINDKEYRYVTPFLASGCLCGVMRHFLIQKGLVQEDTIDIRKIKAGDVVLLFNGVMGCVKGIVRNNFAQ